MKSFFENFPTEEPYAFRKQLEEIHAPDRRNPERPTLPGEFEITDRWRIRLPENAGKFLRDAAEDLKDYFHSSMGVDLEIHSGAPRKYEIELAAGAPGLSVKRSFIFHAEAEGITRRAVATARDTPCKGKRPPRRRGSSCRPTRASCPCGRRCCPAARTWRCAPRFPR